MISDIIKVKAIGFGYTIYYFFEISYAYQRKNLVTGEHKSNSYDLIYWLADTFVAFLISRTIIQ